MVRNLIAEDLNHYTCYTCNKKDHDSNAYLKLSDDIPILAISMLMAAIEKEACNHW